MFARRKSNYETAKPSPSAGSRPAPVFRWFIGDKELETSGKKMTLSVDPEKDVSVATVRFVPTAADHGKYVTCRAVNEYFPATSKEDGYILSVKCKRKEKNTLFFLTSHAMTFAFFVGELYIA